MPCAPIQGGIHLLGYFFLAIGKVKFHGDVGGGVGLQHRHYHGAILGKIEAAQHGGNRLARVLQGICGQSQGRFFPNANIYFL